MLETMRVIIVAGVLYGVVSIGIGSRVAMLLLRLTSSRSVIGIRSDDDFVIGRFTLAGTYNLLMLGAVFGMLGVGMYLLVAKRLLGPTWFRQVTVGLACGAVVGSMLVHADGVDFTKLTPTWFAIALFVALPALFGVFLRPVVTSVQGPQSWSLRGRRRWAIPLVAIVCFPQAVFVPVAIAVVVTVLTLIAGNSHIGRLRSASWFTLATRATWLAIAVSGLVALVNDIRQLA